jgi:hypothetical protein
MAFIIIMLYCYAIGHYAECHILFTFVLNVVMLNVLMLSVVAPYKISTKLNLDFLKSA